MDDEELRAIYEYLIHLPGVLRASNPLDTPAADLARRKESAIVTPGRAQQARRCMLEE